MPKYIVDYDLNSPGQKYSELIETISRFDCVKICKSSWAINAPISAAEIRGFLSKYLDSGDRLIVCEITDWASWNLPKAVTDWLNLP